MTIDREMLAAYAEEQLDAADRARMEAAIAADPALAAELAAHRALRERLRAHYAPVAEMPVPDRLIDAARSPARAGEVIDLDGARAKRAEKTRFSLPSRWIAGGGALAASLALGLLLGSRIGGGPVGSADGQLVAEGALDRALTAQLSAAEPQPVRILLSLRDADGRYCRIFETEALAGLACREKGRWAIERLQSGGGQPGGDYRQAGGAVGEIMAAAQALAPEGALDQREEAAARARNWE